MESILGPILYIDKCGSDTWRFRVHLLLKGTGEQPTVDVSCPAAENVASPQVAFEFPEYGTSGATYWSWLIEFDRTDNDQWIDYTVTTPERDVVDGVRGFQFSDVCIPAKGALPNIAFFSCNGRSHEEHYRLAEAERLWRHMHKTHESHKEKDERGFNLLVGGGDQVYADELWRKEPLRSVERLAQEQDDDVQQQIDEKFFENVRENYVELYADYWSRPYMRSVFARVPGVFTWDDHDIMDGWGSTYKEPQMTAALDKTFEAARDAFIAFQLGGEDLAHVEREDASNDTHFFQTLSFHEEKAQLDLLILDVRTDRRHDRVMSRDQWDVLKNALDSNRKIKEDVPRHLLVVSSIPLVHRRYHAASLLTNLAALISLDDDMIDQWEHGEHRGERDRLLDHLLNYAQDAGSRVTILSGDVHVGARGRIISEAPGHRPLNAPNGKAIIHQITASGIGHPPPDWKRWAGILATSTDDPDPITDEVTAEMLSVSPERPYLRARNWLSARFDDPLEDDEDQRRRKKGFRLWCKWLMEDEGALGEWLEKRSIEQDRQRWDQGVPGMRAISKEAVIPAFSKGDLPGTEA